LTVAFKTFELEHSSRFWIDQWKRKTSNWAVHRTLNALKVAQSIRNVKFHGMKLTANACQAMSAKIVSPFALSVHALMLESAESTTNITAAITANVTAHCTLATTVKLQFSSLVQAVGGARKAAVHASATSNKATTLIAISLTENADAAKITINR
jgi:hypothetical protein